MDAIPQLSGGRSFNLCNCYPLSVNFGGQNVHPAEDNGQIQLLSIPENTLWNRIQHCSHQDQPIRSSQREFLPNNALNGLAADNQNSESKILGKTQQESNLHPEIDPAEQGLEHWDCPRTGWWLRSLCGALTWEGLCSEPRVQPLTLPWPPVSRTQRCSTELTLRGGRRNFIYNCCGDELLGAFRRLLQLPLAGKCLFTQGEEAQISGTMKHPTHH